MIFQYQDEQTGHKLEVVSKAGGMYVKVITREGSNSDPHRTLSAIQLSDGAAFDLCMALAKEFPAVKISLDDAEEKEDGKQGETVSNKKDEGKESVSTPAKKN